MTTDANTTDTPNQPTEGVEPDGGAPEARHALGLNTADVPLSEVAPLPAGVPKKFALLANYRTLSEERPGEALDGSTDHERDLQFAVGLARAGQQQAVGLIYLPKGLERHVPPGTKYLLVWGYRRYTAKTVWIKEAIALEHERAVERATLAAGGKLSAADVAEWKAKLRKRVEALDTTILATVLDTEDPLEIAAAAYRENGERRAVHWTDEARRIALMSEVAEGLAGKDGYPKTYGSDNSIAKMVCRPKSIVGNYRRVAQKLASDLFEVARKKDGGMTVNEAIKLAAIESHADQRKAWEAMVAGAAEGADVGGGGGGGTDPGEKPPSRDALSAILADVKAGGYASVAPKTVPKGSSDFKSGFSDGYAVGFQEAARKALGYATGDYKTFPKPTEKVE